jgi:hypothetical protein
LQRPTQWLEKLRTIGVANKDLAAFITARGDMIKRAFVFNPQWPRHPRILRISFANVECEDPTPVLHPLLA